MCSPCQERGFWSKFGEFLVYCSVVIEYFFPITRFSASVSYRIPFLQLSLAWPDFSLSFRIAKNRLGTRL